MTEGFTAHLIGRVYSSAVRIVKKTERRLLVVTLIGPGRVFPNGDYCQFATLLPEWIEKADRFTKGALVEVRCAIALKQWRFNSLLVLEGDSLRIVDEAEAAPPAWHEPMPPPDEPPDYVDEIPPPHTDDIERNTADRGEVA